MADLLGEKDKGKYLQHDQNNLYQVYIKIDQLNKFIQPGLNVVAGYFLQAFRAKFLHAEARHGASDDDGGFHVFKTDITRFGEMAYEPSGKSISCSGWVEHFFQRQGRGKEYMVFMKEQGTVFSFLMMRKRGPICMILRAALTSETSLLS